MAKFTFKTTKPTGRYSSFYKAYHQIKLKGIIVGEFSNNNFKIRLKVIKQDINEDGNKNCLWKWITLMQKSATLKEAKEFINLHADKIIARYNLVKN